MSWNSASKGQLERIAKGLEANYKYDPELFASYGRMLGDAVRCGDESTIVCFAWYTALEAARGLKEMHIWDAEQLAEILVSKQHDYGHDNINAFGQIGVAVRISDKIARFYNLQKRQSSAMNEPFTDCLMDMVGYGVISAMLADETFNEKLEGSE
jgi:hypothetical protein